MGVSFPILFCQAIKAQYPLLLVLYSRLPGDAGDSEQLVGGAGKAEVRQTRRLVRVTCEASRTRGVISAREDTAQCHFTFHSSLFTSHSPGNWQYKWGIKMDK